MGSREFCWLSSVSMSETIVQKVDAFLTVGATPVLPWQHLKDCLTGSQDLKQVTSLKKFGNALKTISHNAVPPAEKDLCSFVLTEILVTVDPKMTMHRAAKSILQGYPDEDQEVLAGQLVSALSGQLEPCPCVADGNNTKRSRRCVDTVAGLLDNFPLGERSLALVFEKVVTFLHKVLQEFMDSTSEHKDTISQDEAMHNCLTTVKAIIAVVQRCSQARPDCRHEIANTARDLLEALLPTMWTILSNETYLADCRSAAGLSLVLLLRSLLSRDGRQLSIMIYTALFRHLSPADCQPLCPPALRYDTASLPAQSYLYVCHGVLAMLDPAHLVDRRVPANGRCLLLHVLFPEILRLTERLTEPSSALTASRILTLWTTAAVVAMTPGVRGNSESGLVGSAQIPQKLIQYIWTNWDHPIDGIRYQTKGIFENVLKLHVMARGAVDYRRDEDPFLLGLLHSLTAVDWRVRGKYMPLACLVPHLGAQRILGLYPTMPRELLAVFGDQTLAPYACDLLEKLFADHKSFLTSVDRDPSGLQRWQTTWILPLLDVLCGLSASRDQKAYLIEYCVPRLIRCSPESLKFIVAHLHLDSPSSLDKPGQLGALVTCLKTARAMGLIKGQSDSGGGEGLGGSLWQGLVPYVKLREALCHRDNQVRIDALGLLCNCNKTTEPVSSKELALLRFFLQLNLSSASPSFRQQMGAHLKKLFTRLRESGRLHLKQTGKRRLGKESADAPKPSPTTGNLLQTYKDFTSWLADLLFDGLEPGSCYPRRTLALHTLKLMAQIFSSQSKGGQVPFFEGERVWTPDHLQLLLHRLTDPYESNKVMAFDLLSDLSQETPQLLDEGALRRLRGDALLLTASNKPHNCETASFLLRLRVDRSEPHGGARGAMGLLSELCQGLAGEVGVAEASLLEAAASGPMYGQLHCIRELLADVDLRNLSTADGGIARTLLTSLIKLCLDVAQASSPVVCNSSPEGYIPNEPEEASEFESDDLTSDPDTVPQSADPPASMQKVTAQMVLVCCWRSMKEVSLLLGQLALSAPLSTDSSNGLITRLQLEEIGHFFLKLLRESKHRGAFELAYAGFIMLTTRLWKSEVASLGRLPQDWLQELLSDVTSSQSMLCATRRSAGIPFAIQALVSSEPSSQGKRCFREAMRTLLGLALPSSSNDEAVTSQIHALNILRVLYKDTRLGEDVIQYVADGVRASVLGFGAGLWAVRNSSTLLFSALVTRIFGVQRARQDHDRRNCMTGKEFFARFPSLHPFLLQQLKETTSQNTESGVALLHPSLFPVLLLLSRLYPSPMDGAQTSLSMDLFVPYVLECAGSTVYKTRAMAARALVPLVPANCQLTVIGELIGRLPKTPDAPAQHNYVHGVLLQIHELLGFILESSGGKLDLHQALSEPLMSLTDCMWLASVTNNCQVTRAAFLAILEVSLFRGAVGHRRETLLNLRAHAAALAAAGIQTAPSTRASASVSAPARCEPGFVMLQTTCANLCLRWVAACKPLSEASTPALTREDAEVEEEEKRKMAEHKKEMEKEEEKETAEEEEKETEKETAEEEEKEMEKEMAEEEEKEMAEEEEKEMGKEMAEEEEKEMEKEMNKKMQKMQKEMEMEMEKEMEKEMEELQKKMQKEMAEEEENKAMEEAEKEMEEEGERKEGDASKCMQSVAVCNQTPNQASGLEKRRRDVGHSSKVRGPLLPPPLPSPDAVLAALLASPVYEVRLLTLDGLISSRQTSETGTADCQPWATVASSRQIFLSLVTMITEEEHEPCLTRVYELLSYHPMAGQFPWRLPGRQTTCVETFRAAVEVASRLGQREALVSSILMFTACLVPVIYSALSHTEVDREEPGRQLLWDWSRLLGQHSLDGQCVHSRATVASVLDRLAALLLVDQSECLGDIPFSLWGVVMRLLQDDDAGVQQGAVSCIRKAVLEMEPSKDLCCLEVQPSLGVRLGVQVFLALFLRRQPAQCLRTLMEWAASSPEEQSSENVEETQDGRLFDQGEASTSFEGVSLAKVICEQLKNSAKRIQAAQPDSDGQTKDPDSTERTQGTACQASDSKELSLGRSEERGDVLQPPSGRDGHPVETDVPAPAAEEGTGPPGDRLPQTDADFLNDGEEWSAICRAGDRGLPSSLALQALRSSAWDCLDELADKLEQRLRPETTPPLLLLPPSPPPPACLSAGDWEARSAACFRLLLCCRTLAGLLPPGPGKEAPAARLAPLLAAAEARFGGEGRGADSLLLRGPLQSLLSWCHLER